MRRKRRNQKKIIIISALSLVLLLTVGYAAFQTNLSITAKGNIKEKSRVIQAWSSTDLTDFHSDYYKQNIVSVTFLDNNNIPNNATESWNVSEDKENGGVMAWVVPNNSDSTKYDLYIGTKGGVIANEESDYLFYNFRNLKEIKFENNFDTKYAKRMEGMFAGNTNFEVLDLSSFDTRNVVSMVGMFTAWDWDISNWGTNKLSIIIFGENFITSNVTDMGDMFSGFKGRELNLSNFDTSNVNNMYHMFNRCDFLETLNICSFDISNVTRIDGMFRGTSNLKNVYVGNKWKITQTNITENIFYNSAISSVTKGQC